MIILAATQSDQYRKPAVGSFDYLKKVIFADSEISIKDSFYCGDAAGRPKTETKPKDFSDSDIKFAANVGLRFLTPEELFLDKKPSNLKNASLDAFFKQQKAISSDQKNTSTTIVKTSKKEETKQEETKYASEKQEMIIFMGSPGSGKSTFYHAHLTSYTRINQDQLGTKEKCIKACQQALAEKKSVVIDNLNQTKE